MNLKRQLLLVSLLALLLPWAGCEFIRETESALRAGQQQMLAGTARAMANSMAQYVEEYPARLAEPRASEQLFLHPLHKAPQIDGYFDDWQLPPAAQRVMSGPDGPVRFALASFAESVFLFVEVSDRQPVYVNGDSRVLDDGPRYADRVSLINSSPPYLDELYVFAAEAPGPIISYKRQSTGFKPEETIAAYWQDYTGDRQPNGDRNGGYRLEARIPSRLLGTNLGIIVSNTDDVTAPPTRISSFSGDGPGPLVRTVTELEAIAASLIDTGTRVLITDAAGWRIATAGALSAATTNASRSSGWSFRIYDLLFQSGKDAFSAEPDPSGRERQAYVGAALKGREMPAWFRSNESGRAIVAVAAPIVSDSQVIGTLILQQGTDAILSLTNRNLSRLINLTLIVTLLVAGSLIAYASWLSRRIRALSVAAEDALDNDTLQASLPSALAADEIGDLSRSFSYVLRQLGDYNTYLRTLASKLSHELRTPLAIVTSSLENLEHEGLNEASAAYTARAREGADRLRRILSAMSEASRVEELMQHAEHELLDFCAVLSSATDAYKDVYTERQFEFEASPGGTNAIASPELLIQMLDKLVDNAVSFSQPGDTIRIGLVVERDTLLLSVMNPGPPLPERMREAMFDSMVSVRPGGSTHHLGLGLYVAKLIAEGHGGSIAADNVDGGVAFNVRIPRQTSR